MGVLDRFEKGIERAVNGAFAKAFRSEVEPVEIASALRREVDDHAAIVSRDRTLAPNTFVVELGKGDHGRLGEWEDALSDELAGLLREHAAQQRYQFLGPVTVTFEEAEDLDTGLFRVRSTTTKGPVAAPSRQGQGQGPGQGQAQGREAAPAGYAQPQQPAPQPYLQPHQQPAPPHGGRPSIPPGAVAVIDVDGQPYPVSKAVTVIGRGVDADIVLDDPGVSRRHAEIHVLDGKLRLVDLGSTNGTYVDGERIHAGAVRDGSAITMGRARLVVHLKGW